MVPVLNWMNDLPDFVVRWIMVGNFALARLVTGAPLKLRGMKVYMFMMAPDPTRTSEIMKKLDRALAVVEMTDGRWLRHLTARVRRIIVTDTGRPRFRWAVRGVDLPAAVVMNASDESLAVLLVHESTHARLHDRGIRPNQDTIDRVEEVCVRRQAAFSRKIPDVGEALAQASLDSLTAPWWKDQYDPVLREQEIRKILDELASQDQS